MAAGSAPPPASEPLLSVRDLRVRFASEGGTITAVDGLSFDLASGETLAIVGESGSGKSVTGLGIMRLLPDPPTCQVAGEILLAGRNGPQDLLRLDADAMRTVRGERIAMVFQEPMTSLNPVHRIGEQIAEALVHHRRVSWRAALGRAVELLERVGIPEPGRRIASYPHQLSGGMRQRAMIAMALSCDPGVLIADEPTTALDVTIQAQILDLIADLQSETGMAVIFVTHNLGVVAEIADRVLVMYAGRAMEEAAAGALFAQPRHPYTVGLLASIPRLDRLGAEKRGLATIPGNMPDPRHLPPGCAFHPRCPHARPGLCDTTVPPLETTPDGVRLRCARWRELAA